MADCNGFDAILYGLHLLARVNDLRKVASVVLKLRNVDVRKAIWIDVLVHLTLSSLSGQLLGLTLVNFYRVCEIVLLVNDYLIIIMLAILALDLGR